MRWRKTKERQGAHSTWRSYLRHGNISHGTQKPEHPLYRDICFKFLPVEMACVHVQIHVSLDQDIDSKIDTFLLPVDQILYYFSSLEGRRPLNYRPECSVVNTTCISLKLMSSEVTLASRNWPGMYEDCQFVNQY